MLFILFSILITLIMVATVTISRMMMTMKHFVMLPGMLMAFCPGTRNPVCQAHSRMGPRRKEVTLNRRVEDTSGRAGKEVTSDRRGKEVTSMGQRILGKRRQEEVAKASFLLTCGCFQRWKQQQQQGEWSGSKRGATDEQCRRWQQPGVGVETQVHFSLLEQPQM